MYFRLITFQRVVDLKRLLIYKSQIFHCSPHGGECFLCTVTTAAPLFLRGEGKQDSGKAAAGASSDGAVLGWERFPAHVQLQPDIASLLTYTKSLESLSRYVQKCLVRPVSKMTEVITVFASPAHTCNVLACSRDPTVAARVGRSPACCWGAQVR